MEWQDEAIILGTRPHGETHAMVEVFTPSAGKNIALVHGGQSRSKQPTLQAGNLVQVHWKGRGEASVGHFNAELIEPVAAKIMHDRLSLLALSCTCQLLSTSLSEREAEPKLYDATKVLLRFMEDGAIWPVIYAKWEVGLLAALGAGLDLTRCAATGQTLTDGACLAFVSPKSACAVSADAGMPYQDRLLPLPSFLIDQGEPLKGDVFAALEMTGYFLKSRIYEPGGRSLPEARAVFLERLKLWSRQ